MVAWADQLRVEKGESLLGKNDLNWYLLALLTTPMETVTDAPGASGKVAGVISTWVVLRWSMGAAATTAAATVPVLPLLAPLRVAARAPTLTA
jgi:hypothetical protein